MAPSPPLAATPRESHSAISFRGVDFSYNGTLTLKGVNFTISRSEAVGIIGPNGGGKTTLLKLMMGLLKPAVGTVELFCRPPQASIGKIGYVPQAANFDRQFPLSVFELVLSGKLSALPWHGRFRRADKEAAEEMIAKVGLSPLRDRALGTLSGGQIQRALIARALVSHPEILLLDEPTASVDSEAEAYIYELIEELRGKIAIAMVTHDLQAAIKHVNRVLCVQHSVISLQPSEVCEHFAVGLYHVPLVKSDEKR